MRKTGVLLAIGLFAAVLVLALDLGLIWELVHGAKPVRLLGSLTGLDTLLAREEVDLRVFSTAKK